MKTRFPYLLFLPFLLVLAGCPVSTSYPLAAKGAVKLEKNLLGTWTNEEEEPAVKTVTFEKGTETNTYKVTVLERGPMYGPETDHFIGWLAELGGKEFLVLQSVLDGQPEESYYLYHVDIHKNDVTTHDCKMLVGGMDAVVSTEAFQKEILASMKKEDFLDEEIVWKRVK
jgi:hypothetical protein